MTDFILKHETDSKYINNIIEQMPFINRVAFINESVLQMTKHNDETGKIHYINAMDVYERNIDKEIRKMLQEKSFQQLCEELYVDVRHIIHPKVSRRLVQKYNCINFTLYRIDAELGTNIFTDRLNNYNFRRRSALEKAYDYGRNIYEEHISQDINEMPEENGFRENYINSLYWVQKISIKNK